MQAKARAAPPAIEILPTKRSEIVERFQRHLEALGTRLRESIARDGLEGNLDVQKMFLLEISSWRQAATLEGAALAYLDDFRPVRIRRT